MFLALLFACTPDGPKVEPDRPLEELLSEAIVEDALLDHLRALDALTEATSSDEGVRSPTASRAWARSLLEDAGYSVEEQPFAPDGWSHSACKQPVCDGINLVAQWPDEPAGPALLVGGHLDVLGGAGINDNGTGMAILVELALVLAEEGVLDEVPIRFALWDGEETGHTGSLAWVAGVERVPLGAPVAGPHLDELLGYLNIDMVGSPNGVPAQFDTDGRHSLGPKGPRGSRAMEEAVSEWFEAQDIAEVQWPMRAMGYGSSDHESFEAVGVPIASLFTGAGRAKTLDEAAQFGGDEGEPYDACYHSACDDLDNIDPLLMTEMGRAAAWAVGRLAGRDNLVD